MFKKIIPTNIYSKSCTEGKTLNGLQSSLEYSKPKRMAYFKTSQRKNVP